MLYKLGVDTFITLKSDQESFVAVKEESWNWAFFLLVCLYMEGGY